MDNVKYTRIKDTILGYIKCYDPCGVKTLYVEIRVQAFRVDEMSDYDLAIYMDRVLNELILNKDVTLEIDLDTGKTTYRQYVELAC